MREDLGTASTDINVMANCGLAVLNLSHNVKAQYNNSYFGTNDNGNSKRDLFCAACLPGYKGATVTGRIRIYKSCTLIDNCETNPSVKLFNGCG